jgi:hypothetical protein
MRPRDSWPCRSSSGASTLRLNKKGEARVLRSVRFQDFVLQLDATSSGGFRARVLQSPFGEGSTEFSLPPFGDIRMGAFGHSRNLGPHAAAAPILETHTPQEIGAALYHALFQGQVRTLFDKSRGQLEKSTDLGLRLKLKIDPSEAKIGDLADLPWELLCDETEDCFALSRQTSLVRYLDVPRSSQPIAFTPPLQILAVGASPRELAPLDLEEEERRLSELNRPASGVKVKFLHHASAGAVREALSGDSYHVLHFMGHGTFDRASGEGGLAFEEEDGSLVLVSGKAFATKLRDLRSLGVVVLNACDTARARNQGGNPFRGVATALVLGGVPAVVAMQRPISDRAAIGFSTAFYRYLARGTSIDEALTEGRQAIHSILPEAFEWATPVLFLRLPEGNVFVAQATGRPEPLELPAPSAPPPTADPALQPVSGSAPKRSLVVKVSGTAGAVLMASLLYTKVLGPTRSSPPTDAPTVQREQGHSTGEEEQRTAMDRSSETPSKTAKGKTAGSSEGKDRKRLGNVQLSGETGSVPTAPAPANPPRSGIEAKPSSAPTADLSKLSAQFLSIARGEEGGLRVTVSFKNTGDLSLSAVLDAQSSALTDNQGQRYSILGSDLSSQGTNPRIALGAGATASHTLDFQAPKLGSKQFYLALSTPEGKRIRVSGFPATLEGSP